VSCDIVAQSLQPVGQNCAEAEPIVETKDEDAPRPNHQLDASLRALRRKLLQGFADILYILAQRLADDIKAGRRF
jgi:hypothetical protein